VVGTVPAALPSFHITEIKFQWVIHLLGSAASISFLGLLEALAVAKSIATYTRQPLDYNRQCLAEGVANVVGGFFQSLPGSGSLTLSDQLPIGRHHAHVRYLLRRYRRHRRTCAWTLCSIYPKVSAGRASFHHRLQVN
jgi:hypothetical protein